MSQNKISFASDNWAPVHPAILQAVMDANQGPAAAYGGDPWTLQAKKLIEQVFKRKCQVFITSTGTGSNILAYRLSCKPDRLCSCNFSVFNPSHIVKNNPTSSTEVRDPLCYV